MEPGNLREEIVDLRTRLQADVDRIRQKNRALSLDSAGSWQNGFYEGLLIGQQTAVTELDVILAGHSESPPPVDLRGMMEAIRDGATERIADLQRRCSTDPDAERLRRLKIIEAARLGAALEEALAKMPD